MKIQYYPDKDAIDQAISSDDPLLVMVAQDHSKVLVANIDDVGEHIILLRIMGYSENDLDKYFRLVANSEGADWTFVCPSNYKGIRDKAKRIERFFRDGIDAGKKALQILGLNTEITIPPRYRRHMNFLAEDPQSLT